MLSGIDISHHNLNMKDRAAIKQFDFVIMKASEGKTYKDTSLKIWCDILGKDHLKGFYHYCRPEIGNTPKQEADNFLSAIKPYRNDKSLMVIDVEGGALTVSSLDKWVTEWCDYVFKKTGVRPLIYTSEYECKRFKKVCAGGYGLWCAKWSTNKPKKIAPWKFFAIWQNTSNYPVSAVRCDHDYFNGTKEQYLKYCRKVEND